MKKSNVLRDKKHISKRPMRPVSPKRPSPTPQNIPNQNMKEPSVMSSVKHGVASGFGIGAGIEGARQIGGVLFGAGSSDEHIPEQNHPRQEVNSDVNKGGGDTCKILQDIYKETCVDKFEEHTEKCNELLDKFKNLCNRF